jgi:hypothetical protein
MSNCWRLQSIAPGESRANLLLNGEIDMPENTTPEAAPVAPTKMPIPPSPADPLDVVYAEGWNAACEAFFGGKPPADALVITVAAPVAPTQQGDQFLCKAWGETDLPAAAIVTGLEGVSAFLVEQWLGDADHEAYDGTKTLPSVMQDMQDEWAVEGEAWEWSTEFEIGGISVQKVGHPCPEAAPVAPAPQPSPTAGMNMVQRILHVGGRNPPGSTYVEFGSIQAVEALVKQVQRDLPRHQCRRLPDHEIVTMYAECPSSDAEMLDFAHELMDAMLAPTLPAEQAAPAPVAEDAANWHWLASYLVGPRTDLDDEIVASESVNDLRKLVSAARAQAAQPEGGADANR